MAQIAADTYQKELPRLRKMVEATNVYFKKNYEMFNKFRNFVFNSALSEDDINVLRTLQKPQVECNVIEPFISRLCGEFSKQQPSITISNQPGFNNDPKLLEFLENHFRWILTESNNDGFEYEIYKEQLSGGFSAIKIWTEYQNERSFEQVIRMGKSYETTMTGFDPLARKPHKADGRYWFELYPKTKKQFEEEYPNVDIREVSFSRDIEGFNWTYTNNDEKILLICDLYEKKEKKVKIYQLANGEVMTAKEYEEAKAKWDEEVMKGTQIAQAPIPVKERMTKMTTVCRYRFMKNCVLEYVETDYGYLNGIFVDGNSVYLKNVDSGCNDQMTRPYAYQAQGIQKVKNFALQTLANELENSIQSKMIAAKESIPEAYIDAYKSPQSASSWIYNYFYNNDPEIPLPAPQPLVRPPIPPEILQTFQICDNTMQMVLGSFDSSLGINDNQLSGVAIIESATQSNAAAMPFIVSFLQALNQAFQVILDLIPKYYKTGRTLPVVDGQGRKGYVKVNTPGGINLQYEASSLHVKVEAGVNFAVQKSRALQQIIALMQASPAFAGFMNQEGLEILVDNLEVRGGDTLKVLAGQFMQKMKAQAAHQPPNPEIIKLQQQAQQMQMTAQNNQIEAQLKAQELALNAQANETDRLKVILEAQQANNDNVVQMAKAEAERYSKSVDLALKTDDQLHNHALDRAKHALESQDQLHQHVKDTVQMGNDLMAQQTQQLTGENQNV